MTAPIPDRIYDICDEAADMDRGGRETAQFIKGRIREIGESESGKLEKLLFREDHGMIILRTESDRTVGNVYHDDDSTIFLRLEEALEYARHFVNALPMRDELERAVEILDVLRAHPKLLPSTIARIQKWLESVRATLKELER